MKSGKTGRRLPGAQTNRLLFRARILSAARKAIRGHPLTIVAAPMGYGKTTLARSLAEAEGKRALFITVPPGQHDAPYLWNTICTQLSMQGLETAHALRRLGFPETASQVRRAISIAKGGAASPLLIIDDYHHVTDPALHAFIDAYTRTSPGNLRLALFSRTRPALPLEELGLKKMAAVFGREFLAFSPADAREYFRLNGCPDAAVAEKAREYTEGWPAALWLSLQHWRKFGQIDPTGNIDALLSEILFASHGDAEREFLLRVSVMDNFTAGEARKLSADPKTGQRLRRLRENNALLSLDAASGRYQLHSLLRDFLVRQLPASEIEEAPLHRRAGECCLERGELVAAFRFLVKAGRDEDLARSLEVFLNPGSWQLLLYFAEEVSAAVTAYPWSVKTRQPVGYLAFLYRCACELGTQQAGLLLDEFEERLDREAAVPPALRRRLAGEAGIIRALLAYGDLPTMVGHYREAHRLLGGRSALMDSDDSWAFCNPHGSSLMVSRPGEYAGVVGIVENAWRILADLTGGCGYGIGLLLKAERFYERAEFDSLGECVAEAVDTARKHGQIATLIAARFCLARHLLFSGRLDEAEALMEECRAPAEQHEIGDHAASLDLALAYLRARVNKYRLIPRRVQDAAMGDPPAFGSLIGSFLHTVLGLAALAKGDYPRILTMTRRIMLHTDRHESLFGRIHAKTLEAVALQHLHNLDQALIPLRQAVELARPDGILMSLAEYGQHILAMVRQLRLADPDDDFLGQLLELTERGARLASRKYRNQENALTPRQTELMRLVVRGKSNNEIARQLGIAEVTVKKTLQLAYATLGASNRAQAAKRFAALKQ